MILLGACTAFRGSTEPTPPTADGGMPSDAGTGSDAGSSDAKASGLPTTVRCPSNPVTYCAVGETICCAKFTSTTTPDYSCTTLDACKELQSTVPIVCGGSADCAGTSNPNQVCCMFRTPTGTMDRFECVAASACPKDGTVCDPRAPICPDGTKCDADPTGYHREIKICTPPN
jgi:hypothetical protein